VQQPTETLPTGLEARQRVSALYQTHALALKKLAFLMTGDQPTAEDIVQDAFLGLCRRWPSLHEPGNALGYLRASVLNGCRSVHRRAAVARKHAPALAGPAASVPDAASVTDDRGEMAAALRLLPRRQREVLVLRYYLDLDVAEIADTLRISPSAVRATNTRGLASLAKGLRGD